MPLPTEVWRFSSPTLQVNIEDPCESPVAEMAIAIRRAITAIYDLARASAACDDFVHDGLPIQFVTSQEVDADNLWRDDPAIITEVLDKMKCLELLDRLESCDT